LSGDSVVADGMAAEGRLGVNGGEATLQAK